MRVKKMSNVLENKQFKVVRVSRTEFELENGDVYPITFELDGDLSVEEFQKILDSSKDLIIQMLKKIELDYTTYNE